MKWRSKQRKRQKRKQRSTLGPIFTIPSTPLGPSAYAAMHAAIVQGIGRAFVPGLGFTRGYSIGGSAATFIGGVPPSAGVFHAGPGQPFKLRRVPWSSDDFEFSGFHPPQTGLVPVAPVLKEPCMHCGVLTKHGLCVVCHEVTLIFKGSIEALDDPVVFIHP